MGNATEKLQIISTQNFSASSQVLQARPIWALKTVDIKGARNMLLAC
jgi:hypothetical protein